MNRKLSDHLPLMCVLALYLFFVFTNLVWIRGNNGHGWDDTCQHPLFALNLIDYGNTRAEFYPPAYHYVMSLGNRLFHDRNEKSSLFFSMPIYLFILFAGLYGLGTLLGNPWIGVLGAFLTMTVPGFFQSSRIPLLEFPDAALLAVSLFLLAKSGFFRDMLYSALAGVCIAAGMLTKQTFLLLIWLPVIVSAVRGIRAAGRKALLNFLLALFIAALLSFPWYYRLLHLIPQIIHLGYNDVYSSSLPSIFTPASMLYYLTETTSTTLNLFYVALFFLSVLYLSIKKKMSWEIILLLSAIAGAYLGFSLIRSKMVRYGFPCLPLVFIVISTALYNFKARHVRAAAVALLVYLGYVSYFLVGFDINLVPGDKGPLDGLLLTSGPHLWESYTPDVNYDALLGALLDINNDPARNKNGVIGVFSGPPAPSYTSLWTALIYDASVYKLPLNNIEFKGSLRELLNSGYDYIIVYKDPVTDPRYRLVSSRALDWYNVKTNPIYLYKKRFKGLSTFSRQIKKGG